MVLAVPEGVRMKDLVMGDLIVKDSGDLGLDIYHKGKKVCFINRIGEAVLLEWLKKKAVNTPNWARSNSNRILKQLEL
jgi:hypothetical protein